MHRRRLRFTSPAWTTCGHGLATFMVPPPRGARHNMSLETLEPLIGQLLSYAELERLQRREEADVAFTFREDQLYLQLFVEALTRVARGVGADDRTSLLRCAQAFERFSYTPFAS